MSSPSLKFVEGVDLLAHLGDGVVVLLAQARQGGLMLNVGLLEVSAELAEFGLALLVQLDLSGSSTAGLLQALAEFLELAGEIAALFLGLGASSAFCLNLFFQRSMLFHCLFIVITIRNCVNSVVR